jgi:hypothetical protein
MQSALATLPTLPMVASVVGALAYLATHARPHVPRDSLATPMPRAAQMAHGKLCKAPVVSRVVRILVEIHSMFERAIERHVCLLMLT